MFFNQAANEKIEELCYENYFTLIHNGSFLAMIWLVMRVLKFFTQTVFETRT